MFHGSIKLGTDSERVFSEIKVFIVKKVIYVGIYREFSS